LLREVIMQMDWAAYVDVATVLHDLPIDPARKAEVVAQLERIEALAKTVLDFPLEPHVEPAPVFTA
jgi:hypothetical protein